MECPCQRRTQDCEMNGQIVRRNERHTDDQTTEQDAQRTEMIGQSRTQSQLTKIADTDCGKRREIKMNYEANRRSKIRQHTGTNKSEREADCKPQIQNGDCKTARTNEN